MKKAGNPIDEKQIENTPESNALEQSHSFNQSLKNTPKGVHDSEACRRDGQGYKSN